MSFRNIGGLVAFCSPHHSPKFSRFANTVAKYMSLHLFLLAKTSDNVASLDTQSMKHCKGEEGGKVKEEKKIKEDERLFAELESIFYKITLY